MVLEADYRVQLGGVVPDIRLGAAGAGHLVFGEVGIMRRRDVVVRQRSAHVLIHVSVIWVKHIILFREHVHGETILGHEQILPG